MGHGGKRQEEDARRRDEGHEAEVPIKCNRCLVFGIDKQCEVGLLRA